MDIYVLSYPAARAMHDNQVPGCVVTDKLLAQLREESNSVDRGKAARLDRAAKMYAIAKGMGFNGVYISGQGLPYESVEYIIAKGQELAPEWVKYLQDFEYPQENGFYYFEKDKNTGLNLEKHAPKLQKSPGL